VLRQAALPFPFALFPSAGGSIDASDSNGESLLTFAQLPATLSNAINPVALSLTIRKIMFSDFSVCR
jgi:hypothetical protein